MTSHVSGLTASPADDRIAQARVAIVAPAYNEAANIARLLRELDESSAGWQYSARVIIADDGSTDDTVSIAQAHVGVLPVDVLPLGVNRGPGAALFAGLRRALEDPDVDFVVTIESDTTCDLTAMPRMIAAALAGSDVVQGSMHHPDGEMVHVSRLRTLTSRGASLMMRIVTGENLRTFTNLYRTFDAGFLRRSIEKRGDDLVSEPGFAGVTELLLKLCRDGARVVEVPIKLDADKRVDESKLPLVATIKAQLRVAWQALRFRIFGR